MSQFVFRSTMRCRNGSCIVMALFIGVPFVNTWFSLLMNVMVTPVTE